MADAAATTSTPAGRQPAPPDDCAGTGVNTFGCGWTGWWGILIALLLAILASAVFAYMLIAFWPDNSNG